MRSGLLARASSPGAAPLHPGSGPEPPASQGPGIELPALSLLCSPRPRPQSSLPAWPRRQSRPPGLHLRKALGTEVPSLPPEEVARLDFLFFCFGLPLPQTELLPPDVAPEWKRFPKQPPQPPAGSPCPRVSSPCAPRGRGFVFVATAPRPPTHSPERSQLPGALPAGCAPRCLRPLLKGPSVLLALKTSSFPPSPECLFLAYFSLILVLPLRTTTPPLKPSALF